MRIQEHEARIWLFGLFRCQVVHIELHQIGSQFIFVFVDQIFLFLNFVELII